VLRPLKPLFVTSSRKVECWEISPARGVIYSQSVKARARARLRDFDAGTLIKGRKRVRQHFRTSGLRHLTMTNTPVGERPGRDGSFLVLSPPKPALAGHFFLHAFANRTSPREVLTVVPHGVV
jgi:hypothetical protein